MRPLITFLTICIFCSCGQGNEQVKASQNKRSTEGSAILPITATGENVNNKTTERVITDWGKYQDSLRNEILTGKKNKIVKESFLQEMYIRNVVTVVNDSILVNIPFDLHGLDCGAPDCYSTDVCFRFKLMDNFAFPKNVQFTEYEHGCVDRERKVSGSFQLVEEAIDHIIYYSTKYKRTLVLFRANKENGTTAFYFLGLDQNRINGQNVGKILKEFREEGKGSIYPFTSWSLTTNEYEYFLH